MPCTTILVGKDASYDGSCLMARNDDNGPGSFEPKKLVVITPEEQKRDYTSVLSHVHIELPDDPQRYTAVPNAVAGRGIWAAAGINASGVSMTATETITSNPRVLGADPLVTYDAQTGTPGGIGEEDLVYITLPYIHTAREGVERLGMLTETYGTYEMNGIGFSDAKEIWWFESIGGHHWMARRLPDDCYAVIPNQLGLDTFDFEDAATSAKNFMCSKDLKQFVEDNHLDLNMKGGNFNPRDAFGSHSDADHVYNTPRAWIIERYLNPTTSKWDGPDADYNPRSDDIPWCRVPEKKVTIEDIKYLLGEHYQGTPFDPYETHGQTSMAGAYRPIGINRTAFMSISQLKEGAEPVEWICFGSNPFNAMPVFFTNVEKMPVYLSDTTAEVTTDSFYWTSRLIAALADASYNTCIAIIERYQEAVASKAHSILNTTMPQVEKEPDAAKKLALMEEANQKMADLTRQAAESCLSQVLFERSLQMKNAYSRADA